MLSIGKKKGMVHQEVVNAEAVSSQATSSTILPRSVVAFAPPPNTSPSGHSSHSSGTATILPFLLLTHRVNSGLALGPRGSSSVPGVMSAACWAAMISALVRLLGACLLSSLLIVSIWWNCQYMLSQTEGRRHGQHTFSSSFRFSLRFLRRRAIS